MKLQLPHSSIDVCESLKQSNKKLKKKLQATWLTVVGTYLPRTKGTNFSNALESAIAFLCILF
jgi:hypothetical protein